MAVAAVRLPVLGMVGRAFEDVWASLGGVARMAWPWYAAVLAPTLAGEVGASYGAGSALWDVAAGLAGGAAVLACSARWQRHLIMGESLRRPARLDRNVGRYAAALLRVLMLSAAPVGLAVLGVVLVGAVRPGADGRPWAGAGAVGTGLVAAGLLASGLLLARLSLLPPAACVGDAATGLRRSWRATRGNGVRLLAALLILALAMPVGGLAVEVSRGAAQAVARAGGADGAGLELSGALVAAAVDLLALLLLGLVIAGLLAQAYVRLTLVPRPQLPGEE